MDSTHTLIFRDEDTDFLEAIRSGTKHYEVRAWLPAYYAMKDSDKIWFAPMNGDSDKIVEKKLLKIERVSSAQELLEKFDLKDLDPNAISAKQYINRLMSFPGYAERIKEGGF